MREWVKSIGQCSTVVGNVTSGGRDSHLPSALHRLYRRTVVSVVIMCYLTDRLVCTSASNEMLRVAFAVLISFRGGRLIISSREVGLGVPSRRQAPLLSALTVDTVKSSPFITPINKRAHLRKVIWGFK